MKYLMVEFDKMEINLDRTRKPGMALPRPSWSDQTMRTTKWFKFEFSFDVSWRSIWTKRHELQNF